VLLGGKKREGKRAQKGPGEEKRLSFPDVGDAYSEKERGERVKTKLRGYLGRGGGEKKESQPPSLSKGLPQYKFLKRGEKKKRERGDCEDIFTGKRREEDRPYNFSPDLFFLRREKKERRKRRTTTSNRRERGEGFMTSGGLLPREKKRVGKSTRVIYPTK